MHPEVSRPRERFITAQELGELLQLFTDTILDWFEDGKLDGYRLGEKKGGLVRFRKSEIEDLLERWRGFRRSPSP